MTGRPKFFCIKKEYINAVNVADVTAEIESYYPPQALIGLTTGAQGTSGVLTTGEMMSSSTTTDSQAIPPTSEAMSSHIASALFIFALLLL